MRLCKADEAVIFQVLEDGTTQYLTNDLLVLLIHGISKKTLLDAGGEYWEGFVGYVIYFGDGTFKRYSGSWDEAFEQMSKDFPNIVNIK